MNALVHSRIPMSKVHALFDCRVTLHISRHAKHTHTHTRHAKYTHTHTHTHTHTQRVTLDPNTHTPAHVCIMRGRGCSLSARCSEMIGVCVEWCVCVISLICVCWMEWDDMCVLNGALMHGMEHAVLCMTWHREDCGWHGIERPRFALYHCASHALMPYTPLSLPI